MIVSHLSNSLENVANWSLEVKIYPIATFLRKSKVDQGEGQQRSRAIKVNWLTAARAKLISKEWPYFTARHHVDNHGITNAYNHTTTDLHSIREPFCICSRAVLTVSAGIINKRAEWRYEDLGRRRATKWARSHLWYPFSSSSMAVWNQTNGKCTDDHGQEKTSNRVRNSDTLSDSDSFVLKSPQVPWWWQQRQMAGSIGQLRHQMPSQVHKLKYPPSIRQQSLPVTAD